MIEVNLSGQWVLKSEAFEALTTTTSDGVVELVNGKWNRAKVTDVCPFLISWKVERGLHLYGNHNPHIIKQVRDIGFPVLLELGMGGNFIESIELLHSISAPSLKLLRLDNNRICSIAAFRKLELPMLESIYLDRNCVQELPALSRLASKKLLHLNLEIVSQPATSTSISWIFKMEACNLEFIYLQSRHRIEEMAKFIKVRGKTRGLTLVSINCMVFKPMAYEYPNWQPY